MNREIYKLSFSAFFADLGYQGLIALFPILIVVHYAAPVYYYGLLEALNYGVGSLVGFVGGMAADRWGRRKVALIGNSMILLMSFSALPYSLPLSAALFIGGWWMRNFRTPARRAMLTEVATGQELKRALGLLHSLDVGGGTASVILLSYLLYIQLKLSEVFLSTAIFFFLSTFILFTSTSGKKSSNVRMKNKLKLSTLGLTAGLFGLSTYSFGFPVLTLFQASKSEPLSILSYAVFLLSSALVGVTVSRVSFSEVKILALMGYGLASLGNIIIGTLPHVGFVFLGSAILGASTGVVETMEPFLVTKFASQESMGTSMGLLSLGRSLGLLSANAMMGFLYYFSPFYAYLYAFFASISAALIVLTLSN
ncbi:MFS transporter [Sulfodiicoccus acidiphilus]|uniref:MFS transporter n=1 Tax=Sulfodiicoccus acidiphilus TaxID=1670455 RepID=A0A348B2C2_9CREN|nr:MFS transporter [Sulfodiicoccus acidiphilus]BBD72324.1 MFS transporter [Sulfodiicoccus acidiphilus]